MKELKEIEKTIQKKYRKEIFSKFVKAVKDFNLIEENDVIAVCISGGKDSFLLAKCMQELKRHNKFHFELKFIVMNPGYNQENLDKANKKSLELDNKSKEVKEIIIKKDVVDPDDVEMLQDLIITCVNEALRKVDSAQASSFGKYNIPGLM